MDWTRYSNPLLQRRPNPEAAGPIRAGRAAKGQSVRIADVVLIGPLMIWGGTEAANAAKTPLGQKAGASLALMGLGTIAFNGINYGRVKSGEVC